MVHGFLQTGAEKIRLRMVTDGSHCGSGLLDHEAPKWMTGVIPAALSSVQNDAYGIGSIVYSVNFPSAGEFAVCVCSEVWGLECARQTDYVVSPIGNVIVSGPSSVAIPDTFPLVAVSGNNYTIRLKWLGLLPAASDLQRLRVRRQNACVDADSGLPDVFGGPDEIGHPSAHFQSIVFGENFVEVVLPPTKIGGGLEVCWCSSGTISNSEPCVRVFRFSMDGAVLLPSDEPSISARIAAVVSDPAVVGKPVFLTAHGYNLQKSVQYFVMKGLDLDCASQAFSYSSNKIVVPICAFEVCAESLGEPIYGRNVERVFFEENAMSFSAGIWTMCARIHGLWTSLGEFNIGGPTDVVISKSNVSSSAALLEDFDLIVYGEGLKQNDSFRIIPAHGLCSESNIAVLPSFEVTMDPPIPVSIAGGLLYRSRFLEAGVFKFCWCGDFCAGTYDHYVAAPNMFTISGPIDVVDPYYEQIYGIATVGLDIIVPMVGPPIPDLALHFRIRNKGCCGSPLTFGCKEYVSRNQFEFEIASTFGEGYLFLSNVLVSSGGEMDLCYCPLAESSSSSDCNKVGQREAALLMKGQTSFEAKRLFAQVGEFPVVANYAFKSEAHGYGFENDMRVYSQPDQDNDGRCDSNFNIDALLFGVREDRQHLTANDFSLKTVKFTHPGISPGTWVMCAFFNAVQQEPSSLGIFDVIGPSSVISHPNMLAPFEKAKIVITGFNLSTHDSIKIRTNDYGAGCGVLLPGSLAQEWKVNEIVLDVTTATATKATFMMTFRGSGSFSVCYCGAQWGLECGNTLTDFISDPVGMINVIGPIGVTDPAGNHLVAVTHNTFTARVSYVGPIPRTNELERFRVRRQHLCEEPDEAEPDIFGGPDIFGRSSAIFQRVVFGEKFVEVTFPAVSYGGGSSLCWCDSALTPNSQKCMRIGFFKILGAVHLPNGHPAVVPLIAGLESQRPGIVSRPLSFVVDGFGLELEGSLFFAAKVSSVNVLQRFHRNFMSQDDFMSAISMLVVKRLELHFNHHLNFVQIVECD